MAKIGPMKVLMLGWEFPPHISGGLGTACFGLTESLIRSDTKILFVIPKTDKETNDGRLSVISASNIDVPRAMIPKVNVKSVQEDGGSECVKAIGNLEVIRINAELPPYTTQDVLSEAVSLSNWNYQFSESNFTNTIAHLKADQTLEEVNTRYSFSGGYGPNLQEEVAAYGLAGAEIARQNSFDIIHAHDWLTFTAGIAAKKVSGKPLVVHVHATEFDRSGNHIDTKIFKLEQDGMNAADHVIAVSEWTKNILVSRYSIPANKILVVHNGVRPATQCCSKPPSIGKRVITFLGRITYQKGPEYFVDSAAKVLLKYPDVHFVMAGSGDLLPKMIERVARLRIASQFHFTGFLHSEKVEQLLTGTTIYVMPSVSEPFGISPLEAVQAGVPVIISRQSGVAEVMQHVVKIDYWNVEALADAMCNILKYQCLSKMLKSNSKHEISNITWERAAIKINNLYHELTTQK
jgi:glycosyltransferase involved in cell wall biosynthesis